MGDSLKKNPILAKLGFDETNQWILYKEEMQPFFSWMAKNITEENIATDAELYEERYLKEIGQWYTGEDLENRLSALEEQYPGILSHTENDLDDAKDELKELEEIRETYRDVNTRLEKTKLNLNREISDLELEIQNEEIALEEIKNATLEKVRELQKLQIGNLELMAELVSRFSDTHTPPLFMHEMPLDDFFTQVERFEEHLNVYLKTNLKIKTTTESSGHDDDDTKEAVDDAVEKLTNLERQLYGAELKVVESKALAAGYQNMIDELDINRWHAFTPSQMKQQIKELEANTKELEKTCETQMSELKTLLRTRVQQQVEDVLYENTKTKMERAKKRLETVKKIAEMVSDTLINAEMLLVAMQFDLEKAQKFSENSNIVPYDTQGCTRRIEAMLQLKTNTTNADPDTLLHTRLADELTKYLKIQRPTSAKDCLYEYEKACRMGKYTMEGIAGKKYYISELKVLEDLRSIEKVYSARVFDGPTARPMLENPKFIQPIYEVKQVKEEIERETRRIRYDIQTNLTEKMNADRLWRYRQLLWIWFLTEPKKVIQALEEVKKAAAKTPTMKTIAGIKRKNTQNN